MQNSSSPSGWASQDGWLPAGSIPTSLDPLETIDERYPFRSSSQRQLHAVSSADRRAVLAALATSADATIEKRCSRIAGCCAFPLLCVRSDGKPFLSLQRCKDRLCPLCQYYRGTVAARRFGTLIRSFNAPRFLTLTLKHSPSPLTDQLDRLAHCFRQLRQRLEWKRHVLGGCYSVEVTRNVVDGTWHVHCHIAFDGFFWEQSSIAQLWLEITGDSSIVHIAAIHDASATAKYVAKYITKPSELSRWPASCVIDYANAMHGRRLIHTFGTAHSVAINDDDNTDSINDSEVIISVPRIVKKAATNDQRAVRILELMRRLSPTFARASGQTPLPFQSPRTPIEDWELTQMVSDARAIAAEESPATLPHPPRRQSQPPGQSSTQTLFSPAGSRVL